MNKQLLLLVIVALTSCAWDNTPVSLPPRGLILNVREAALFLGSGENQTRNQLTLTATITPLGARSEIKWESSDPEILTVVSAGNGRATVTAMGEGKAIITATTIEGGFSAICEITVFKALFYSQFGAVGDGVTDDIEAIRDTHAEANRLGIGVRADPGAVYFIGSRNITAVIRTDTDWGDARFIMDERNITGNGQAVFRVESSYFPIGASSRFIDIRDRLSPQTLAKNQNRLILNPPLDGPALIEAVDNQTRRYIRRGANENIGSTQRDFFIICKNGWVDMNAPIKWDYNRLSTLRARPIDEETLTIRGGFFTTIADNRPSTASTGYVTRGILIERSNTIVENIQHTVTGEIEQIRPSSGFLRVQNAANVTIRDSTLTGRRVFNTRGTYDLGINSSVNVRIINVDQTNCITDRTYWGLFISNFSKNLYFNNVRLSRFDAHQGVHNVTILNSELGWMGIQLVGSGTLRIENTTVRDAARYIALRNDYGATWEGNIYIRNGRFYPRTGNSVVLVSDNDGQWNFGYPTFMPRFIYIDGFHVVNSGSEEADIISNNSFTNNHQPFPHTLTERIFIRNFTTSNGRPYRSANSAVLRNIFDSRIVDPGAPSDWNW